MQGWELGQSDLEYRMLEGTHLGIFLHFAFSLVLLPYFLFLYFYDGYVLYVVNFFFFYQMLVVFFLILFYVIFYTKKKPVHYLHFRELQKNDFCIGIVFVIVFFIFIIALNSIFGFMSNLGTVSQTFPVKSNYYLLNMFFIVVIEELVFRGLILYLIMLSVNFLIKLDLKRDRYVLKKNISKYSSVLINSIVFGFAHYFLYKQNIVVVFQLILLGILLSYLTVKFGIWSAILLHMVYNSFSAYSLGLYNVGFNLPTILVVIILLTIVIFGFLIVRNVKNDTFDFYIFSTSYFIALVILFHLSLLILSLFKDVYNFFPIVIVSFAFLYFYLFRFKFNKNNVRSLVIGGLIGCVVSSVIVYNSYTSFQAVVLFLYSAIFILLYFLLNHFIKLKYKSDIK